MSNRQWNRRHVLQAMGAGVVGAVTASRLVAKEDADKEPYKPKGNIKQSVCRWCYDSIALEKLTEEAKKMGYESIELLGPEDIKVVKKLGLTCAMMRCASIPDGLNRKENHEKIEKELRTHIDFAAAEGLPNVICMSGNRKGLADDEGLKVCAEGLKRVLGYAEEKKITICMEGLNSKVDHKDYQGDHTAFGLAIVKAVGSPRVKLLSDLYHMQIMEGDLIRTLRDNKEYIAHFHTGGVPGRHELDDTQEVNWRAVASAIAATGYQGYMAHEFVPTRDPLTSLREAVTLCDV